MWSPARPPPPQQHDPQPSCKGECCTSRGWAIRKGIDRLPSRTASSTRPALPHAIRGIVRQDLGRVRACAPRRRVANACNRARPPRAWSTRLDHRTALSQQPLRHHHTCAARTRPRRRRGRAPALMTKRVTSSSSQEQASAQAAKAKFPEHAPDAAAHRDTAHKRVVGGAERPSGVTCHAARELEAAAARCSHVASLAYTFASVVIPKRRTSVRRRRRACAGRRTRRAHPARRRRRLRQRSARSARVFVSLGRAAPRGAISSWRGALLIVQYSARTARSS